MPYLADYLQLLQRIAAVTGLPEVSEVLLPGEQRGAEKKDEFGFVLLADGSAGPFYTSLGSTLPKLRESCSDWSPADPMALARRLGSDSLHLSALALGAFNALSQHLMREAGFDPAQPGNQSPADGPDNHLGMVGYFPPLAERYLQQGRHITVIERQPERVPPHPNLALYSSPEALAGCDYVICTASTLINNSIDRILDSVPSPAAIHLFGPSASGLPDPLFSRGLSSVGGIVIDRVDRLRDALAAGEPWGDCGRKYRLSPDRYPGIGRLLSGRNQGL